MNLIPWCHKREHTEIEKAPQEGLPRLRREIDSLFGRFFEGFWGEGRLLPRWRDLAFGARTDLAESDDDVTVKVELPGVDAKDVDLRLEGNVLMIRGEKKEEKEEKKRSYHYVERQFGSFHRTVQLPGSIDPEKVDATFKDGVLTVTVAKRPGARPKPIDVKSQ